MFYKGQKQTAQHRANAKAARQEKYGMGKCMVCGDGYKKYSSNSVLCGKKECKARSSSTKYRDREKEDPILARAYRLSGTVRMGENKVPRMKAMLEKSIGNPCEYCGDVITLATASLDHKIPRIFGKVYSRTHRKMIYLPEEVKRLDQEENLHIVCRTCNRLKLDMSDEQFRCLLDFLNKHIDIKKIVFTRFNRATTLFTRNR